MLFYTESAVALVASVATDAASAVRARLEEGGPWKWYDAQLSPGMWTSCPAAIAATNSGGNGALAAPSRPQKRYDESKFGGE